MKSKIIPHTLSTLRIISISSLTIFTLYSAQAIWNPPTSSAPNGNVGGPLTTATSTQIKTGSLGILDNLSIGKTLIVNGAFKFATTSAGVGKVLTSDASGNATWADASTISGGGSVGVGCGGDGKYLQDIISSNTSHGSITKTTGTSETKTLPADVKYFVLQGSGSNSAHGLAGYSSDNQSGGASWAKIGSTGVSMLIVAGGSGFGPGPGDTGGNFGSKNNDGTFSLKTAQPGSTGDVGDQLHPGLPGLIGSGGAGGGCNPGSAGCAGWGGAGGVGLSNAGLRGGPSSVNASDGNGGYGGYGFTGSLNDGKGGAANIIASWYSDSGQLMGGSAGAGGGGGYGGGGGGAQNGGGGGAGGSYVDSRRGWVCEGGVYFSTDPAPAGVGNIITIGSSAGGLNGFVKLIW